MEYILENLFFLLRCKFKKMVIMSKKSSTNIRKSTVLGSVVLALGREANRPYCENVSILGNLFYVHSKGRLNACLWCLWSPLLILIFKAPRSVLLGLIVKHIESSEKNVSTPPRMHFEKTKRMVMMSINSIVKFMGPVSVVKVLRRANIAIKSLVYM